MSILNTYRSFIIAFILASLGVLFAEPIAIEPVETELFIIVSFYSVVLLPTTLLTAGVLRTDATCLSLLELRGYHKGIKNLIGILSILLASNLFALAMLLLGKGFGWVLVLNTQFFGAVNLIYPIFWILLFTFCLVFLRLPKIFVGINSIVNLNYKIIEKQIKNRIEKEVYKSTQEVTTKIKGLPEKYGTEIKTK